ncbi:MAG: efflux RND transporter permease subunit, partial [Alphaproteobacteria bacterium]
KVPGLFETREDVAGLPIRAVGDGVVTLGDVADIRRTFKDVQTITRFNGKPALAVWGVKRLGENAVDTTDHIREAVAKIQDQLPAGVAVDYTNDMSSWVFTTQNELESAVSTAIVLVMIIIVAALGLRSGMLVGIAIPSSFMFGFVLIGMFGQTLNMMVMFGLVLSVGLLVDGAIVIVELADRKMAEGMHRKEAYGTAAKRMAWPIISSTATTLAAFLPLLAWPGVTGEFMAYLPRTLIFVLCGSLVVAMIFLPVLGSMFGRPNAEGDATLKALAVAEGGDPLSLPGFTGRYARLLDYLVQRPARVLLVAMVVVYACMVAYGQFGRGVEYSADMEPQEALVIIGARGNFSPPEIARLVQDVEKVVLAQPGVEAAFTELGSELGTRGQDVPRDTVATINMEFTDWKTRKDARLIIQDIRDQTKNIPGVYVEVMGREQGPRSGKEINIQLSHKNFETLLAATGQLREWMETVDGLVDIEDTRPLPGIDWQLQVDREQAARFGMDVTTVGGIVQLMTNGMMIGDYRPDDAKEEVDIRIRFPATHRSIESLDQLKIQTSEGPVPITNFVTRVAKPRVSEINRIDGERITEVKANPVFGQLASDKLKVIKAWLDEGHLPEGTQIRYRGSNEDQQESTEFLGGALLVSLFLMGIILITQFNSFYHAFLILSAIVLSTVGALVGMLIRDQAFSVIMTGTGIIALAGIVVNNNIVLVDTYQHLVREGEDPIKAVVRTGAQRLRPVLLTTVTTICGILPMAYHLSVNFFSRDIEIGSPVGMWWVQLATAIVYGLGFATILTLLVTPCMIALPHVWKRMLSERRARKSGTVASTPAE